MSFNTLYHEIQCPFCHTKVNSGIGFRVGSVEQAKYKIGDKLNWQGQRLRPKVRPDTGNLKTIGYFNCDNPSCETWDDCYPRVQEALITIENDLITKVEITAHKPGVESFDIVEPAGLA